MTTAHLPSRCFRSPTSTRLYLQRAYRVLVHTPETSPATFENRSSSAGFVHYTVEFSVEKTTTNRQYGQVSAATRCFQYMHIFALQHVTIGNRNANKASASPPRRYVLRAQHPAPMRRYSTPRAMQHTNSATRSVVSWTTRPTSVTCRSLPTVSSKILHCSIEAQRRTNG